MSSRTPDWSLSRREFLARSGAGAATLASGALGSSILASPAGTSPPRRSAAQYPIGIELYAVRTELAKDLSNTLKTVKQIGYEAVEFYAPYLAWSVPQAKDVRKQLDDLGLKCFSTHNTFAALTPGETMTKAIALNQAIGSRNIILASPPSATTPDDWKRVAAQLATASQQLKSHGMFAGFHNHHIEWKPVAGGQRPMDILAASTPREFVLQFDVGTCLEAGADPVAWIKSHPGRIKSVHLKDWAPGTAAQEKGYRVLFGEGVAPWKEIFTALESAGGGGVEYYLMEQEGSRYSEFDTAKRCLGTWLAMRTGSSVRPSSTAAFAYVGGGDGKITRFALDEQTGALTQRTAFDGGQGTSFLAVAPDNKTLFAVNETERGEVSSFAIQPRTGDLKFLSRTSSGGSGPAHLSVDRTGHWLLTANYGGGTSAVIPIRPDGTLGAPTSVVASGAKSHYITASPDNRFVLVACLEPNHVAQYRLDARAGTLTPTSPAVLTVPGTKPGPRHLAFHPNGKLAFLMNELNSTVSVLRYDPATGFLSVIQTLSALQGAVPGNTGAEIQVHPNGRFVYSSNRGHNSIAVFSLDQATGRLTLIGTTPTGGRTPRHFSLNESGTMLFVANQNSGNIVAMRVNADGTLAPLGEAATGLVAPQFVSVVRVPSR